MDILTIALTALMLSLGATVASGTLPAPERAPLYQSFDLRVAPPPSKAHYNGSRALVYELHLTNYSETELSLKELQVVEMKSGRILADFSGATLEAMIGKQGRQSDSRSVTTLFPRIHVIIYLTVPLTHAEVNNAILKHRIVYAALGGRPHEATIEGGEFRLPADAPISLGPPLRGPGWTAVYSDAWERGHRRVAYATNGSVRIPGRFAIDWIKVAADGTHAKGADDILTNWYGYGADVLAVADGRVAAAVDDIADPATVDPKKTVDMENASGNYVVLDLGGGKYAFYEHLKSKSIKVRGGDHVHRGQVIGLLGYTGQSTGPHLHFHVADSTTPLNAEGIPYVFREFKVLGAFASFEAFGQSSPWVPDSSGIRHNELPASFAVVEFP